jgi:pantoate--beta-alanine ligase
VQRLSSIAALRTYVSAARGDGRRIGLVPTMGALHAGHLALVRSAAAYADTVVVSVFVNPTQFDRPDDLVAYPRDLDGDERALTALGSAAPAVVFAPDVTELYPDEPLTSVHVAALTDGLCGATRPGHFDGVATVVTKLLNIVGPDVAVFGRKDAQQLRVIRRMVADLDLPVEVVAVPTVRESDGLALSSRNRRLSADERASALALPTALRAAVQVASAARDSGTPLLPEAIRAAALAPLVDEPGVALEYLEVVDPETLGAPAVTPERVLVALAAQVGPVRLIDNVEIGDLDDEGRLLHATADLPPGAHRAGSPPGAHRADLPPGAHRAGSPPDAEG